MPNIISSPEHSIVNFNDPVLYCGIERPFALPAPDGVGFQVIVTDATAGDGDVYWLGICDNDCNIIHRYNITGTPLCYIYSWANFYGGAASWPTADKYPVIANTCYGEDEFFSDVPYAYDSEEQLLAAVSEALGVTITTWDEFENCCRLRTNLCLLLQDADGGFYGNIIEERVSRLAFTADTLDIASYIDDLNCFRYCVIYYEGEGDASSLGCSQLFRRDDEDCYRTTLKYYGDDNQFDFVYRNDTYNLVRIPMWLRRPNFPTEEKIYRRSNGTYRRQYATVEKEWEVTTEYLPEWLHQRMIIALKHDHVLVTSPDADLTEEELTQLGSYDLEYIGKEDVYSPATFRFRQPIDGMNRSCNMTASCCIPLSIAFEFTDELAGTGFIYFAVGSNATGVQVRYKLNIEEEWTTRDVEAATSPLAFDYLSVSPCDNDYYEVQIRTKCGTTYSAWSPVEIVRSPTAVGYPVVDSITLTAQALFTRLYIVLRDNSLAVSYTYDIENETPTSVGSGTTTENEFYSNVIIGGALDTTYTFTITANGQNGGSCTISGTITIDTDTREVVSWTTTQV